MENNKLYENRIHFNYNYIFSPNFKRDDFFYKWILKKYTLKKLKKNILKISKKEKIFIKQEENDKLENNNDFNLLKKENRLIFKSNEEFNFFKREFILLMENVELDKNIHPFRLKSLQFKKEYVEILILFLLNYESVMAENIINLEKISRKLNISSIDIEKFMKNSKIELERMNTESHISKIFFKIENLKLNDIQERILILDLITFNYYQKDELNKFENEVFKKLSINKKILKYIKKEIIKKSEGK